MIELNPLISISQEIRAWLDTYKSKSKEKKAETKKAIEALSIAVLETKSYIQNGFKERILEKESEIRDYWNQAHIELRSINSELAMRCFSKAEYWTEPNKWDSNKIKQYNITLTSMSQSLKEI